MSHVALTIAGFDPSAGAGITADLRTFSALDTDGISVITAITAQSSSGVFGIYPVAPEIVSSQLSRLLDDSKPDSIKIGMLGGAEQVSAITAIFERRPQRNIVLDPVLASTDGVPLLDSSGRYLLLTTLLQCCTLVTPNLAEAAALTGIDVSNSETMIKAGEKLLAFGAKAVLIKGGHLPGAPNDWLVQRGFPPIEFVGERILTEHTHGTGCLLSSAIAAGLAKNKSLVHAVEEAKALLSSSLSQPVVIGKGRGYPNASGRTHSRVSDRTHAERLAMLKGLYVVGDSQLSAGRSHFDVAKAAYTGGASVFQLRDKNIPLPELINVAKQLSKLASEMGKLFVVNDRVDVALASNADGVHLGPDDMNPRDARRLLGPDKLVGVSTGTVSEAEIALDHASYFGVGAIYGSTTKLDAGESIGPERIEEIRRVVLDAPIVAIGGINQSNIQDVIVAGADSVAVVSAVVAAADIVSAAADLTRYFR